MRIKVWAHLESTGFDFHFKMGEAEQRKYTQSLREAGLVPGLKMFLNQTGLR